MLVIQMTLCNGVTAVSWVTGIFFYPCNLYKPLTIQFLFLPLFEDFAEMHHWIVIKQINRSHCYSFTRVSLHSVPHYTHLPHII